MPQCTPSLDVMPGYHEGVVEAAQIAQPSMGAHHFGRAPQVCRQYSLLEILPKIDGVLGEHHGSRPIKLDDHDLTAGRMPRHFDQLDAAIPEDVVVSVELFEGDGQVEIR